MFVNVPHSSSFISTIMKLLFDLEKGQMPYMNKIIRNLMQIQLMDNMI